MLNDGEAALKYLRKEDEHTEAPTPGLVLLDLKMPGVNGFEVLKVVKAEATQRSKSYTSSPNTCYKQGSGFTSTPSSPSR